MSQVQNGVFNTLSAMDQWMRVIGSNVTGSTVTGYRGTDVQFGDVLASHLSLGARPSDGYGSVNPVQRSDSGVRIKATTTDFTQGSITANGQPTNLAINGDGFFVLSRTPNPRSISDLSFTRDGTFKFEFLRGDLPNTGTYRLVNSDGLFVMGYSSTVDANRPFGTPPEEAQGTDNQAFANVVGSGAGQPPIPALFQNIQLDLVRNPEAAGRFTFDAQGLVRVGGAEPRDVLGRPVNMHVALAKFANPEGLRRGSSGASFQYDVIAGQVFSGTAAAGNDGRNRVVGATNVLTPGALENSNTSINTTLPEITLAQKSFSSASKLLTVANDLIEKVEQIIK